MKDFRDSTADAGGHHNWSYRIIDEDGGVRTREISPERLAKDMTWLAKEKWATEQRINLNLNESMPLAQQAQVTDELRAWLSGPIVLERAQHSIARRVVPDNLPIEAHILLVQHDWRAVLKDAHVEGDDSGGYQLPYPVTIFEFSFRGSVRAVVIMGEGLPFPEAPVGTPDRLKGYITFKTRSGWFKVDVTNIAKGVEEKNKLATVLKLVQDNIKAVCAMLEAEVAEVTPMREVYRRNTQPTKGPPLPKVSHHIVSLAHRKVYTPCDEHEPGTPKRLHFRRGHWRHYPNHRTWIKWTLVGNPDLGFVDKEYRL